MYIDHGISRLNLVLRKAALDHYDTRVRPHPQYVRQFPEKLKKLEDTWSSRTNFELQIDFSGNSTVYDADILITDWSGTAYEYSFTTLKPTLFINTPMKVMNPDYKEISVEPFDIEIRSMIVIAVDPEKMDQLLPSIDRLLHENTFSKDIIKALREKYLYNVGKAGTVGADYLVERLIEKSGR